MRTSLVLVIAFLASAAAAGGRPIDGCWYSGDGTGVNLTLALQGGGTYKLTWTGCLGVYGTAKGTWKEDGGTLSLSPSEETDMLKEHPIRTLRVVLSRGQEVLVPPDQEADVQKNGPDQYNSYSRTDCATGNGT
jgi:hypothetical protein